MKRRIVRGGSFIYDSRLLRLADRVWGEPEGRSWDDGFRIIVVKQRRKP